MNLQSERTIAIHLPIYFEREEAERESVQLEDIFFPGWFMQEFDLIVIAMRLDTCSKSITKTVHIHIHHLSEMVVGAPFG